MWKQMKKYNNNSSLTDTFTESLANLCFEPLPLFYCELSLSVYLVQFSTFHIACACWVRVLWFALTQEAGEKPEAPLAWHPCWKVFCLAFLLCINYKGIKKKNLFPFFYIILSWLHLATAFGQFSTFPKPQMHSLNGYILSRKNHIFSLHLMRDLSLY